MTRNIRILISQIYQKNRASIISHIIILACLLIPAFFYRVYQLEKRVSFGADQEVLAFKAVEILSGDLALLGTTVSVGGFSLGPLFTYLWAGFQYVFSGDPISGSYLSIFLGLITIILLYISGLYVFNSRVSAFVMSFIYAFSYSFYVGDISPWTPSLFYISQIIITSGAYLATKKSLGFIVTAIGVVLGFQAHVSVFVSLIPVAFYWLLMRKAIRKTLTAKSIFCSVGIILIGFSPNILYDLTHNFINTKRILNIFSIPTNSADNPSTYGKVVQTGYMSLTGMLFPSINKISGQVIFLGVFFLGLLAARNKKNTMFTLLALSIFLPTIVFLFWRGNFSEYYLALPLVPVYLFMLGYVAREYYKKFPIVFLIISLIFAYVNIAAWQKRNRPFNLYAMKSVVKTIVDMGGAEGYGVSLSAHPGYKFGYHYLFYYYGAKPDIPPLKGETKIFSIIVPAGYHGIKTEIEFDGIGLLWEGVE